VLYYGTWLPPAERAVTAPVLGYFAECDEFEPLAEVGELEQRLRAAGTRTRFHVHGGTQHWFAEPDRPEYDAAATELAWTRTIDFLRTELT
jgi:carboxymethylenebutenolidase